MATRTVPERTQTAFLEKLLDERTDWLMRSMGQLGEGHPCTQQWLIEVAHLRAALAAESYQPVKEDRLGFDDENNSTKESFFD